jgi:hypothetical protein
VRITLFPEQLGEGSKEALKIICDDMSIVMEERGEPLLVIPKSLEREVVTVNHEPIFAGHPGRKRTIDILKLRYGWPGMTQVADKLIC